MASIMLMLITKGANCKYLVYKVVFSSLSVNINNEKKKKKTNLALSPQEQ